MSAGDAALLESIHAHGQRTIVLARRVAVEAGYSAAFLVLGAVVAVGFVVFWLAFPGRGHPTK